MFQFLLGVTHVFGRCVAASLALTVYGSCVGAVLHNQPDWFRFGFELLPLWILALCLVRLLRRYEL